MSYALAEHTLALLELREQPTKHMLWASYNQIVSELLCQEGSQELPFYIQV